MLQHVVWVASSCFELQFVFWLTNFHILNCVLWKNAETKTQSWYHDYHDNTCPSTSCSQAFLVNMISQMNSACISKYIYSGTKQLHICAGLLTWVSCITWIVPVTKGIIATCKAHSLVEIFQSWLEKQASIKLTITNVNYVRKSIWRKQYVV